MSEVSDAGRDCIGISLAVSRGDAPGAQLLADFYRDDASPLVKAFATMVWTLTKKLAEEMSRTTETPVEPREILEEFSRALTIWEN